MSRVAAAAIVLALVLALGSPVRSAPVTFDLTGVVGWWLRASDQNAGIPGPPNHGGPCTFGLASPPPPQGAGNDCFRYAFAEGSSITIDITGGAVTMLGGSLVVDAVTPVVFGTIVLTSHFETTIGAGAMGTLQDNWIDWSSPASVVTTGTLVCSGVNCPLISMPEGDVFPWSEMFGVLANAAVAPRLHFVYWELDPSHTAIVNSAPATHLWSHAVEFGNRRSAAFTFGPNSYGYPLCESDSPPHCGSWYDPPPWETPEPQLPALLLGAAALVSAQRRRTR